MKKSKKVRRRIRFGKKRKETNGRGEGNREEGWVDKLIMDR
jgi:hypothetical protein